MKDYFTFKKPLGFVAVILVMIFILDLNAPLEMAVGILYILCFFLICNQSKKAILGFAAVTIFMAVTKFIIFYNPNTSYIIYTNRIMAISAISIITYLSLRYRTMVESRNSERLNYEKQLEEMLFLTSHKVRKPLTNCSGLLNLFDTDQLTELEQHQIINHLKTSITELDVFTKDLSIFIDDLKKKKAENENGNNAKI